MDLEELQIEVQALLIKGDESQLKEIASHLSIPEDQTEGKSKFKLLQVIRLSIESSIAKENNEDSSKLLKDLISFVKGTPPALEGEEDPEMEPKKKYELLIQKQKEELEQAISDFKLAQGQSAVKKSVADKSQDTTVSVDLKSSVFRREFRIKGQIGEPNQADKLSYIALVKQIDSAVERGYTQSEIVDSIVQAIVPGMYLQSYLIGLKDLTLPRLRKILRSHYREKDATSSHQDLITMCQEPKESPLNFLIRALDTTQKVLFASQENTAGPCYNHDLVQSMFIRCFETGFQDDNIASKMRSVLKDKNIADEDLIEKLNEVFDAENERQTKLHPVSKTKVNKVINSATTTHAMPCDVETKAANKKPEQKPEKSVQAKLLAAVETMQAEIVQLREIVNQQANGKSGGARPRSSFGNNRGMRHKGCTSCIAHNNIGNCHHCYKCGSAEHFMVNCPKVYCAPESENMKRQPSGGRG